MSRSVARFAALAPCVALLAVASTASAASTISIPSTLNLTSKVLVNVPVTYNCPQFPPSFFPPFSSGSVSVQQAVGQAIAQGSTSLALTCDGTTHTAVAGVTAGTSGPFPTTGALPFHGGPAIAQASLSDCLPFSFLCDNAATGWQAVKLSGAS
jgi:hypothetical protein